MNERINVKRRILSAICALICMLCFLENFFLSARAEESDSDRYSCASAALRDAFFALDESVDLSEYELSSAELTEIFTKVIKDEPLLFYVSGTLSYTVEGDRVASAAPIYTMTQEEILASTLECERWADGILGGVCDLYGDAETAAYLYGEVCARFDYDQTLVSGDLYSAIKCGSGTCQSYTAAYIWLLRKCGIDACFAASDTMKHIWVLLELDGEWYHADPTWDDGGEGGSSLDYFLLSDAQVTAAGHSDWYSPRKVLCLSEQYGRAEVMELRERVISRGDGDHSGGIDLLDLALLRTSGACANVTALAPKGGGEVVEAAMGAETDGGESFSDICSACLDLNFDGEMDALDADLLREKLLSGD